MKIIKIKSLFLILLFSLTFSFSNAQKNNIFVRYWNSLVNDTSDVSKPKFLIYPTIAYAPETSWEFGLSQLLVYHAKRDTSNRLSEINGFTFFTLENQFGLWFDHALYTNENKWFFFGRSRFQSFPLLYYGIGPDADSDYIARIDANQLLLRERILRNVGKNFFLGVQLDLQRISSVNFVPSYGNEFVELPTGSEGSTNFGLGLGLVYDTRHNVLNVRDGLFSELTFLKYSPAWGSTFNFNTVLLDTRIYKAVNKRDVIATQILGHFNTGDTPFNLLSLMGGENIMRGYYLGRFRDKNQIAAQIEYRFLPIPFSFSNRIGTTIFAGAGRVFNSFEEFELNKIAWSAGIGGRFLLFPKKDIFSRIDVAFTPEGPGFYIFIGEAF